MPRKPRFFIAGVPNHVVQRGRNKDPVFFEAADYEFYLAKLAEALDKYDGKLHAYVLMTNHVHLLLTGSTRETVSRVMQYVGRYYVPYINHKYRYSGSIWQGRFKSSLIDSVLYLFLCMKYIELNPVRAEMVDSPQKYRYSSFHKNALGKHDALISPQDEYLKLSSDEQTRCQMYKSLFETDIDENSLNKIRQGYQTGTPVGSSVFSDKIEAVLGRKIGKSKRGRPRIKDE